MNEYEIDGYKINTYFVDELDVKWMAWNDEGDPRYVDASTEEMAIDMLLDILRANAPMEFTDAPTFEPFSRAKRNVWRPGKGAR